MNKQQIQRELIIRHQDFISCIEVLSEEDYTSSPPNKWTAGQQLDHICRATAPVLLALKIPRFILRLLFGKPSNISMSYNDLVKKYQAVLHHGGKASGMFIPHAVAYNSREGLKNKLNKTIVGINLQLDSLTEAELDNIFLPHPLLGKLSLREMLYFTLYHVDHHKMQVGKGFNTY